MPGPYTRVSSGDDGNSGPTAATTVVNAHSTGLEAVETLIGRAVVPATANGIVQDGRQANVTISGTTVTATGSAAGFSAPYFDSSYVGKSVWLNGASSIIKRTITAVSSGTQATLSSAPGDGTYSAVYGTDNTSTLTALSASLTKGQALTFPAGEQFVITEGGHALTSAGAIWEGTHPSFSKIVVPSLTANLVRVGAAYCKVRQLGLYNSAAFAWFGGFSGYAFPTAGAAIRQDDQGAGAYLRSEYDDLELFGFYNNARTASGWGAHFRRVWNVAPVSDGIVLASNYTDLGDWHVLDGRHYNKTGQYAGQDGAQIKWLSGGDLDIRGNNFQDGSVSVDLALTPGADSASFSTNVRISDNSHEDPSTACVRISPTSGTSFQSVVIASSTMNSVRGGRAVDFTGPGSMSNFVVSGNANANMLFPIFTTSTGAGTLNNGRISGNSSGSTITASATNVVTVY